MFPNITSQTNNTAKSVNNKLGSCVVLCAKFYLYMAIPCSCTGDLGGIWSLRDCWNRRSIVWIRFACFRADVQFSMRVVSICVHRVLHRVITDIGIISGVLAMNDFTEDFNVSSWTDSDLHLNEEGAIVSTFIFGNLVGALLSSVFADKCGRRTTMIIGCTVFLLGGGLQVAAHNLWTLYVGRGIAGLAIGLMTMIVPLFNAELAPASLRGRLITFNQIAMTGGIMVSYWVNYGFQFVAEGWRYALSGQLLFALVLLCGLFCVPQSPRWLVMVGRSDHAFKSLLRLRGQKQLAQRELFLIEEQHRKERLQHVDTWRGLCCDAVSLRRLVICSVLQSFQQLTGINSIMYYMPSIAAAVGFGTNTALGQTGINGIVNFLSTFLAFIFVDRFGRRPLLLGGALLMGLAMTVLALLGTFYVSFDAIGRTVVESSVAAWSCVIAIYVFVFAFAWSWGPICWLYPTEAFPTSQRAKGVSITTASNFAWNIVIAQFVPELQEDILKFALFAIFALLCAVMFIFVQVLLPETRQKSLEELSRAFDVASTKNNDTQKTRS